MEQISISPDTFKDGSSLPVEHTCDGEAPLHFHGKGSRTALGPSP